MTELESVRWGVCVYYDPDAKPTERALKRRIIRESNRLGCLPGRILEMRTYTISATIPWEDNVQANVKVGAAVAVLEPKEAYE
jgi:hypothetical protein